MYLEQYRNGTFPDFKLEKTTETKLSFPGDTSYISDEITGRPEVFVDPKTGRWKRFRYRKPTVEVGNRHSLIESQLKPVHRCIHSKVKYGLFKDLTLTTTSRDFAGNYLYDRDVSNTYSNIDGGQIVELLSPLSIRDTLDNASQSFEAGGYINHDWFALADKFNEVSDQFIGDKVGLGETLYESEIFLEAFKIMLNPTNAVRSLIKIGTRLRRHRSMNLGELSKKLLKGSANANLYYQFGIKPAIRDITETLKAHESVSDRLDRFRMNAGRYLPIRVRDVQTSSHRNEQLDPVDSTSFAWQMLGKTSTATIGAWGRVRSDLNFTDDWIAYLQYFGINKMVGLYWELIPFSFVVDWFTNFQERINSKTRLRAASAPYSEIRNLWSSVKQQEDLEFHIVPGPNVELSNTVGSAARNAPLISRRAVYYTRDSKIPDTSGVLDFSALGLFHAITGGSLIIQRW